MSYYLFIREGQEPDWGYAEAHIRHIMSLPPGHEDRPSAAFEELDVEEDGTELDQLLGALEDFKKGWTGEEVKEYTERFKLASAELEERGLPPRPAWMFDFAGGVHKEGTIGGYLFVTVSPDSENDPVEPESYMAFINLDHYGVIPYLGFVKPMKYEGEEEASQSQT